MSLNPPTKSITSSLAILAVAATTITIVMLVSSANAGSTPKSPISSLGVLAVTSMSALDAQPATGARVEEVASDIAEMTANPPKGQEEAGTVDPRNGYMLLSRAEGAAVDLIAFPTSAGKLCYQISAGTGGCFTEFRAESPVNWTIDWADPNYADQSAASGASVVGLFPDSVTGVTVVAAGGKYLVSLGKNAFFVGFDLRRSP